MPGQSDSPQAAVLPPWRTFDWHASPPLTSRHTNTAASRALGPRDLIVAHSKSNPSLRNRVECCLTEGHVVPLKDNQRSSPSPHPPLPLGYRSEAPPNHGMQSDLPDPTVRCWDDAIEPRPSTPGTGACSSRPGLLPFGPVSAVTSSPQNLPATLRPNQTGPGELFSVYS